MTRNQPSVSRQQSEGLLGLVRDLRLAWRLFRDPAVPLWTKAIPVLSLGYVLWPLDFLSDSLLGLGQLDDITVIILGIKTFLALCPKGLVNQHQPDAGSCPGPGTDSTGEVIETTYRVLDDRDES